MEGFRGEGRIDRTTARKQRDEEFEKLMKDGMAQDAERLAGVMNEHKQGVDAAQAKRDEERQKISGELRESRERLDELGEISKKLDGI